MLPTPGLHYMLRYDTLHYISDNVKDPDGPMEHFTL